MKSGEYDKKIDELIGRAIGRQRPTFDFNKWRQDHQKEIQTYKAQVKKPSDSVESSGSWRTIMKSPITKFAAAAVIIIAVLVCINQFGGSIHGTSVAWASLVEKLDKIHSYMYVERRSATSGPQKEGFEFIAPDTENIVYCSENYGTRTDNYQSGKLRFSFYALSREKAVVSVLHTAREYTRYQLPNGEVGRTDPREMIRRILLNDYTELGRETIDGLQVEGVELNGQKISGERLEDAVTRLWVDVETGLPVRIELEGFAYGTSTKVKIVQDEFQWNVQLLESDFEPDIPPDYIFVERELPSARKPVNFATVEENQELNLPDLEDLTLLGLEPDEKDIVVPLVGMNEIWRAQDEVVGVWPDYSDVWQRLQNELVAKLDIDNLPIDRLLATAVALREKFWKEGGCLSKISYPYGYAARIIFESAHDENPEDMTITDELVETIQSVQLAWKYQADSNEKIRNIPLRHSLIQLRTAQFEQIVRELKDGRLPVWADFVRVNDLAILLGSAGDYQSARQAAEWLIQEAEQGEWTEYMGPLNKMKRSFNRAEKFNFNIYLARKSTFPEEFRYGRRLPSFKGPKKRGVVPVHILTQNPVWSGH